MGAFIVSKDDKLLLGKSTQGGVYPGYWVIPGGGVDEGETRRKAVEREVDEETGIDISEADVVPIDIVHGGESEKTLRDTGERVNVKMVFNDFQIKLGQLATDVKVKCEDDFTDARWFSTNELPGLKLTPPTIESLKVLGLM